jgi:hypothetical protein
MKKAFSFYIFRTVSIVLLVANLFVIFDILKTPELLFYFLFMLVYILINFIITGFLIKENDHIFAKLLLIESILLTLATFYSLFFHKPF